MSPADLLCHELLHLLAVAGVQVYILLPVLLQIPIQICAVGIVQIVLIGKIQQYRLGQFHFLLQIQRHHIIFIQTGDAQFRFNAPPIPVKCLRRNLASLDQQPANLLQHPLLGPDPIAAPQQGVQLGGIFPGPLRQIIHLFQQFGRQRLPLVAIDQHLQFKTPQPAQHGRIHMQKLQRLYIEHRAAAAPFGLLLQKRPPDPRDPVMLLRQIQKQPGHPPLPGLILIDPPHPLRRLGRISGVLPHQSGQIQVIGLQSPGLRPVQAFSLLQQIQGMIQQPLGLMVSPVGNQKLGMEQSGRHILLVQSRQLLHQLLRLRPG